MRVIPPSRFLIVQLVFPGCRQSDQSTREPSHPTEVTSLSPEVSWKVTPPRSPEGSVVVAQVHRYLDALERRAELAER